MNSLEETLAQANLNMASATGALNDVNSRIAAVQTAGTAAIASLAASMIHTVHLDPASGDDTADGSETAPLLTLTEVQRRTPMGGLAFVRLHGDLIFTQDAQIYSTMIIQPADGVHLPRVAASGAYLHANGRVFSYGFHVRPGGNIVMRGIQVGLAQWSSGGLVGHGASLFKHYNDQYYTDAHIGFVECEFDPGANPVGAINSLPLSSLRVLLPVENASMLGRWSHYATSTSGTDPLTVRQLTTDLTLI